MGNKPVQCYMGTSVPNKEHCPLLCTHFPFEMNWAGLWIPWWKNAVLLKSAKKKGHLGFSSKDGIFRLHEWNWKTSPLRTQWMLWSIVYCRIPSASPCVTPQHIPSPLSGKKTWGEAVNPNSFCFQTHPTSEIFALALVTRAVGTIDGVKVCPRTWLPKVVGLKELLFPLKDKSWYKVTTTYSPKNWMRSIVRHLSLWRIQN